MNYLGNVSILERGSAPAQAIIDRNARSMAERMANETKEELEKVMNRVENICRNFEMTDELYIDPSHNMEYVSDISELAEILKDQVKKKKYQAQVTIFVVGFQDVSAQKLKLLQQISEFFSESMKTLDDEEMPSTPDVDLLDLTYRVDETLDYARGLAQQLGELNQNIIDYLLHYAENKAKNKGKKKLEKALQAAKDDMTNLSEKLLSLQADLEDKDEKLQQLYKQIEIKTLENQKYKSAAEIAKKNLLDSQALREEIGAKDEKIKDMRQIISRLEIDLAQERHNHEQSINRLENSSLESQQKMLELQKGVDGSRMESNEAKWEMEKLHESQLKAVLDSHSKEIEELKQQHKEEIEKLMEEIDALRDAKLSLQKDLSDMGHGRKFDFDLSESTSSPSSRQLEHEKETDITTKKESRSGSRSSFGGKHKIKDKTKDVRRENSNVSSNSESEEIVQNKRSKSTLETVAEDFDTVFDLLDEDSWSNISSQDIPARFNQYRKLSQNYINELQEKLQMTLARTHRKVETLKAQFLEHKNKWDTERNLLLDQVKQAQNLQNDAERETDTTLTQLESFISEQEKLEQEESRQRQEMMRSAELLNKISPRTNKTPSADDDLTKLMEQTDDAKALASSVAPSISKGNEAHNENKEISDKTQVDEDIRVSSGRSQQSLRSHYKSKIEETKKAALERKNKAVEITKSIEQVKKEEETLIDEDHEGYLKSFGYSVSGELLPEHPVVQEYLKTYHSNLSFKDALSKVLLDKDMMSASQCISDLEIALFNPEAKILPQLQKMTKSTVQVLDEIISLLKTVLQNERDGPVSSMINISRDPTFLSRDKTPDSDCTPLPTRQNSRAHSSHRQTDSAPTDNADNDYLRDLQQQCLLLRNRLDESTKKHEEQLKHNTELMVEMQHTINGLQKELSTLGKAPRSRSVTPHLPLNQAPSPETSIMFTRLDAERNAKIMKKAVNDEKLDENKYKDAVSKMDRYISLPAQRLGEIVRKYLHHSRMKKIEEAVRKHKYLENDVFDCLDKMANLQSLRAKRWSDKMDELGTERLRMANLLMDTLDNIENESGIFLIKPMYSYCGRELLNRYNGKLSRPSKAKARSYSNENQRVGPVPTPASNIRTVHHELSSLSQVQEVNLVSAAEVDCVGSGVSGSALNWVGTSKAVWNASTSQPSALSELGGGFHNTPRILELDINRMLIGQNNISSRLCYPLTDDRLVNASQNTLRTYVTVNRPAVQPKLKERPYSATGAGDSNAPPTTPQLLLSTSGLKRSSAEFPQIQSTSPLPPINKTRNISASSSRLSSDGVHFRHDRSHSGKTITTTTSDDE